jgi:RNA-directed DNA polymerase
MRSKGLDDVTIRVFKTHLEEHLGNISAELRSDRYVFGKLRAHAIDKSGSTKKRPLQIPVVRDRVVMKAIALFIAPAFDKFNLSCSFAYIKRRGIKPAITRIRELIEQGNKYYLESDIIDFFGSVDREMLWEQFSKHVRHKSLLPLIKQCFSLELGNLQDLETEDQQLFQGADSGIPQGGVLSPMLANFYLYKFDRPITKTGFNLVRYADDFVILCESKEKAELGYKLCEQALQPLKLAIHPLGPQHSKTKIGWFPKDGLTFLGLRFEGKEVFPAKKSEDRFVAKVAEILDPASGLSLFQTLQKLSNLINGWGKCYNAMRVNQMYLELDVFIKKSVTAYLKNVGIQLTGKNKRKQMKLLGIPPLSAMVVHAAHASKLSEISARSGAERSTRMGTRAIP